MRCPRIGGYVLPAESCDTLLKLFNSGPVHSYPDIYENWDFFVRFQKSYASLRGVFARPHENAETM